MVIGTNHCEQAHSAMSQLEKMIIQYGTISIQRLNHAAVLLDVLGVDERETERGIQIYSVYIHRYECMLLMH